MVATEVQTRTPEGHPDQRVELPQQNEPTGAEATMETNQMNSQVGMGDAADNVDPPSLPRASSPIKVTQDVPSHSMTNDEVTITGEARKAPEALNVLAKFMTKDEPIMSEKGKAKLEISNFEDLNANELHQIYLTRLSTSRDMEVSMVNMQKRKYEV